MSLTANRLQRIAATTTTMLLVACGSVVPETGEAGSSAGTSGSTGQGSPSSETMDPSRPGTSVGPTSATSPSTTAESSSTSGQTTSGQMTFGVTSETDTVTGVDTLGFLQPTTGPICGIQDGGDEGFLAHCSECSVWDQNCPDGEKCNPWANDGGEYWNGTKCTPVAPAPGQAGDSCVVEGSAVSGVDTCDVGLLCFDVDPKTNAGTCAGFCAGDERTPVCEDPGTQCVIANEGVVILCLPSCDPLAQDCGDGFGCYGVGLPGEYAPTVCAREDVGVWIGGIVPAFCPPGSTGVSADLLASCDEGDPCCATWCELADPNACPAGLICESWHAEDAPGVRLYGVCLEG